MIPDSHIGTPSRGSDLDSTLNRTADSLDIDMKESRIGTPSRDDITASEREDNSEDGLTDIRESPALRPLSTVSHKERCVFGFNPYYIGYFCIGCPVSAHRVLVLFCF